MGRTDLAFRLLHGKMFGSRGTQHTAHGAFMMELSSLEAIFSYIWKQPISWMKTCKLSNRYETIKSIFYLSDEGYSGNNASWEEHVRICDNTWFYPPTVSALLHVHLALLAY